MTTEIAGDEADAAFARQQLLSWFEHSGRSFPWRYNDDPYKVLIAEMMLRRTQARQVVPVFENFVEKYPNARLLSEAPLEWLQADLRPLGLAWRAANFEHLAAELVERHQGEVPQERDVLLALTGVGPYVTEAVRIFAFSEPGVIVDTNTVRVAARLFGFEYNAESRRKPAVIKAVSRLVDQQRPADSGYALLDFAAIICQARKPEHHLCPLNSRCAYYRKIQSGFRSTPGSVSAAKIITEQLQEADVRLREERE